MVCLNIKIVLYQVFDIDIFDILQKALQRHNNLIFSYIFMRSRLFSVAKNEGNSDNKNHSGV